MRYVGLAAIYDQLMDETVYDGWRLYIEKVLRYYRFEPQTVVDLACGTGRLASMLAGAGYQVTGIDLSDDMLAVADQMARERHLAIRFSQQDIAEWRLEQQVDMAVCFCDSLNYLPAEEAFERFLRATYNGLKPGGLLLFDIHAPRMFTEVFNDRTFTLNEEGLAYIWEAAYDEKGRRAVHEMTFFQQTESGLYRRFEEIHQQHLFMPEDVLNWLEEAGFAEINRSADFTLDPPTEASERLFFAARRR